MRYVMIAFDEDRLQLVIDALEVIDPDTPQRQAMRDTLTLRLTERQADFAKERLQ